MCDHTSCAQVHELPQSHCGDNWEDTLFLWLHINYTHLALVRFEHSVCRESLMTTYWITCGNSWTWADDVWLPITGTNESTMNTLYIRAFQIVLRGGRWVYPRWGRWIIYFARGENFFNMGVGTWGVILNLLQSWKQLHLKSNLAWPVYTKNMKLQQKRYRSNDYS